MLEGEGKGSTQQEEWHGASRRVVRRRTQGDGGMGGAGPRRRRRVMQNQQRGSWQPRSAVEAYRRGEEGQEWKSARSGQL